MNLNGSWVGYYHVVIMMKVTGVKALNFPMLVPCLNDITLLAANRGLTSTLCQGFLYD